MRYAQSLTLYNRSVDPVTRLERWARCVLRGVRWQGGGAVTDRKLPRAGSVMAYIPFSAGGGLRYAPPADYAAAPEGRFTLQEGDILFLGEVGFPPSLGARLMACAGAHGVVSVGERGFGSPRLRHWEVCAR